MSCMPARYDFQLYEGADCKILQTTNGEDLTGCTIQFEAAEQVNASPVTLTITGVIDDAATGKYHIPITAAQTDGLATGASIDLRYDVFITKADGTKEADTYGVVKIISKVGA